jgi:hypothetical protein
MGDEVLQFGSRWYLLFLNLLVFARGMDLLSTRLATPHLRLEANPVARRLGWKWGLVANAIVCGVMAHWPLPAVIVSTTSLMVAARNFQGVWLMRSLGEDRYQRWMAARVSETSPSLYLGCLFAQVGLVGLIGGALVLFTRHDWVPFGIGLGLIAYALAVLVFTLLAVWRVRRSTLWNAADLREHDHVLTDAN